MITKAASGVIAMRNTKANFGEKSAPLYLTLNLDEKRRAANVQWLKPGDERLAGMTAIPVEQRIVQVLARSEGGISIRNAIAEELGMNHKTVSNHLTNLRTKVRVERLGDGRWRFLPNASF
jgi:DNA-binding NarL/FixJ family response regulator